MCSDALSLLLDAACQVTRSPSSVASTRDGLRSSGIYRKPSLSQNNQQTAAMPFFGVGSIRAHQVSRADLVSIVQALLGDLVPAAGAWTMVA